MADKLYKTDKQLIACLQFEKKVDDACLAGILYPAILW